MLPNWLYGKSKSKLASILGGGGSIPEDYDQVKAQVTQNAEDILLLSDALDNKAALTQITNPNLLDNPWFTVNQRDSDTYSGTDIYTVDRWKMTSAEGAVVISNGVSITSGSTSANYLQQYIPNETFNSLIGKIVTFSVLLSDGTVYKVTNTVPARPSSGTLNIGVITDGDFSQTSLYIPASGYCRVQVGSKTEKTISIRAVKLEVGSVSTLAMDTAPDMATELLKCQRYFIRLSGTANSSMVAGYSLTENGARFPLALPTNMRTLPVLNYSTLTDWGASKNTAANAITPTSMSISGRLNNIIILEMVKTGSFTAESHYQLCQLASGAYLDFSAEL